MILFLSITEYYSIGKSQLTPRWGAAIIYWGSAENLVVRIGQVEIKKKEENWQVSNLNMANRGIVTTRTN